MKQFTIRSGLKSETRGAPEQRVEQAAMVDSAALVGADFPGLRPHFDVSEGDAVHLGMPLFSDRRHRAIRFVAPMSGTVKRIEYGPRRTLSAIVIERTAEGSSNTADTVEPIDAEDAKTVREVLQLRGLWPAFRSRPFGHIPEPEAVPDAVFVNAVQQGALAPDPAVVLADRQEAFETGLRYLTALSGGPVHLCQSSQSPMVGALPNGVETSVFRGSSAAALTGTHIDRLRPIGGGDQVWSIGYQDVIAVGHLFQTGAYDAMRVVALSGPRAARPRLIRTCVGADLKALTAGEVSDGRRGRPADIWSGDPLAGRHAAFLGRYHTQITITHAKPGPRPAASDVRPIVPMTALDHALPFATLPVPLMRALSVGDTETAERLGCASMVEEDVAVLTHLCASGADYGKLLRQTLDVLEKDAA